MGRIPSLLERRRLSSTLRKSRQWSRRPARSRHRAFSVRPSPNRACDFHRTRLSSRRAQVIGPSPFRLPSSPMSRSTCRPSPCARLSLAPTTTTAPSPIGLAPRRRSRVPAVFDVRARVRCPTHDLPRPHWSVPVGRREETGQASTGSVPTAPRQTWCGGRCVAPLVIGVRAIQLSPYRAGLAGRCSTRLRAVPLSQHALVPLAFRRRVSWVTRDRPS
jgi:hypothetical protein